ncbi:hypothetical protein CCAX7_62710 [Capsulimonas corticalis]|uniref:Uncharacterized protein n=1 Tax=Capsulimonas corticalis TaxID=2219043 RepID=A0A402CWL8_9BACT|nr:hypothetical protein [Capsulimonas corticalis]BDI34220.1 hypothetical protein CCAX7_62710 [Capsulimonas corticalis]
MPAITIDGLVFTFPQGWIVEKYDDWAFHQNRFQSIPPGRKAVDLIAISPNKTLYLLEVKDYRHYSRSKSIELTDEITIKVVDTLAALIPAKIHANNSNEKDCARKATQANEIHIVFHLEQPAVHSKLYPQVTNTANLQQRLRQMLRAVDPHLKVVSKNTMQSLPWTVT